MKDILFLANGNGEDSIACRILDEIRALRPALAIDAWAMVGQGEPFRARGVDVIGAQNLLPSAGFATTEWRLMLADLKAGWIGTYLRQARDARRLPGRYRLLVAVGDIVPLAASVLAKTPFAFVACAKSDYYDPGYRFTRLEKRLMRRHCAAVYPRDHLTARSLAADGIPVRDLGNPMMDDLEGTGDRLGLSDDMIGIGMFPGTRDDAETNFLDLLDAARAIAAAHAEPARLRFLFPVRSAFSVDAMVARTLADPRFMGLSVVPTGHAEGVAMRIALPGGAEALVARGRFADALRLSRVVVGMAGTANEQAVGMGIPLVNVPSRGVQGENFMRMKMQYFGESAVLAPREPTSVARAVTAILADPARAARMGAAGRERMGAPGASAAIAADIVALLERHSPERNAA